MSLRSGCFLIQNFAIKQSKLKKRRLQPLTYLCFKQGTVIIDFEGVTCAMEDVSKYQLICKNNKNLKADWS